MSLLSKKACPAIMCLACCLACVLSACSPFAHKNPVEMKIDDALEKTSELAGFAVEAGPQAYAPEGARYEFLRKGDGDKTLEASGELTHLDASMAQHTLELFTQPQLVLSAKNSENLQIDDLALEENLEDGMPVYTLSYELQNRSIGLVAATSMSYKVDEEGLISEIVVASRPLEGDETGLQWGSTVYKLTDKNVPAA